MMSVGKRNARGRGAAKERRCGIKYKMRQGAEGRRDRVERGEKMGGETRKWWGGKMENKRRKA